MTQMQSRALRLKATQEKSGLTRTRIYEMMDEGTFPRPIKIGKRAIAWLEHEVDAWLQARVAERDKAA